jgi:hypothetical protein
MAIAVALIGVAGVVISAVVADYLRRKKRRMSDKEALAALMQFFDHQAWRRPFNPWTPHDQYDRFEDALSRTKKGIATGRFESRQGEVENQGVARRDMRDPALRSDLQQVIIELDELEVLVARCRKNPSGSSHEVSEVERLRGEIVERINRQAAKRALEPLPLPMSNSSPDAASRTTADG